MQRGLQINAWSNQLESVSYALIALVGLYLLATQLIALCGAVPGRRRPFMPATAMPRIEHAHGHEP